MARAPRTASATDVRVGLQAVDVGMTPFPATTSPGAPRPGCARRRPRCRRRTGPFGAALVVQGRPGGQHDGGSRPAGPQRLGGARDRVLGALDGRPVLLGQAVMDPHGRHPVGVHGTVVECDGILRADLFAAEPAESDDGPRRHGVVLGQRDRRSVHLHDLAVEWLVLVEGHPAHAAVLGGARAGSRAAARCRFHSDAFGCPAGPRDDLGLVVEVPAEGGSRCPTPTTVGVCAAHRAATTTTGQHPRSRAGAQVLQRHAGDPAAVEQYPPAQRAGEQFDVVIQRGVGKRSEHHVGARPVTRPVGVDLRTASGIGCTRRGAGAGELPAEPVADHRGERGMVQTPPG